MELTNVTYTISLDNVPRGDHQLTLYAHNPVGWSVPLRDEAMMITVVSGAHNVQLVSLGSALLTVLATIVMLHEQRVRC